MLRQEIVRNLPASWIVYCMEISVIKFLVLEIKVGKIPKQYSHFLNEKNTCWLFCHFQKVFKNLELPRIRKDYGVGRWFKMYVRIFMPLRKPVNVKRISKGNFYALHTQSYQMLFLFNKMFTSFCSKIWYFFTPT